MLNVFILMTWKTFKLPVMVCSPNACDLLTDPKDLPRGVSRFSY